MIHILVALAMLAAICSAPARAAQTAGTSSDSWQFELTPYLWLTGMNGSVEGGRLPRVGIDMSFSDIWDHLDLAAMGTFEARKGRLGILFDAIYMKLSSDANVTRTGPGPIGATLSVNADAEVKQTMLAAALAYRISDGPTAVDLVGGARYVKLDISAQFNASLFGLTGTAYRSSDKDWTDPYIGLRVAHPLNDRWIVSAYGDYGGFSVGSDVTWQYVIGAEYKYSKSAGIRAGFRELRIDYNKDAFIYDIKNKGPYIGVGIRF